MAEQQYQHRNTQFYVEKVQSGVLSLEDVHAYERVVMDSIEQFGDDDGHETRTLQSIREARTVLKS